MTEKVSWVEVREVKIDRRSDTDYDRVIDTNYDMTPDDSISFYRIQATHVTITDHTNIRIHKSIPILGACLVAVRASAMVSLSPHISHKLT